MRKLFKKIACRLGFHKFYLSGMKHFEDDYVCINCGFSPTAPFNYVGSNIRSKDNNYKVKKSLK